MTSVEFIFLLCHHRVLLVTRKFLALIGDKIGDKIGNKIGDNP